MDLIPANSCSLPHFCGEILLQNPPPKLWREVLNGIGKCWLLCQRLRQVSVFCLSYTSVKHPQNIGRESFGSHIGVYTSADISSIAKNSVTHPCKCRHFSIGHIFCDTSACVFCGFTGPRSHPLCFYAVCLICFYTCTVRFLYAAFPLWCYPKTR